MIHLSLDTAFTTAALFGALFLYCKNHLLPPLDALFRVIYKNLQNLVISIVLTLNLQNKWEKSRELMGRLG